MPQTILVDEFHRSVYAPAGLPEKRYDAIRQTLDERGFNADWRRAIRAVCQQFPSLAPIRVRLTR